MLQALQNNRIRENCRFLAKKASFPEIVNASVNQTLARSINTSLTTLITLGALYLFGGETTKDFVLAMIVGIEVLFEINPILYPEIPPTPKC